MDLQLDRLTLRLAGVSPADGRRLATLVGHGLAAATAPATGGTSDALSLAITARPGEPIERLAHRIVVELVRALARSGS